MFLLDVKIKAYECGDNVSTYELKNKRNDFLHKVSKKLSENQTIAVENLMIRNMTKKAKG